MKKKIETNQLNSLIADLVDFLDVSDALGISRQKIKQNLLNHNNVLDKAINVDIKQRVILNLYESLLRTYTSDYEEETAMTE